MKKTRLGIEKLEDKSMMAGYVYSDPSVSALIKKNYADNFIDRNEAISIFNAVANKGIVNQREMRDVRQIANLNMSDDIKYFSKSLLNNPANKVNENLRVGSSNKDVLKLIDRWFLGKDRPTTPSDATYKQVNGNLFVNGASDTDIRQGMAGDCYFLAALQALATKNNTTIQQMFKDNRDSTWTITFYMSTPKGSYVKEFVTVDSYLPVNTNGYSYYASFGDHYKSSNNELWVSLAEKGYAQWSATGHGAISHIVRYNSYHNIDHGGWSNDVFKAVSGKDSSLSFVVDELVIQKALSENKAVTIFKYVYSNRTGPHAYFLKSYSSETGKYILINPWGHSDIEISSGELKTSLCYGFAVCSKIG
jgi:hypothetical protein